MKSTIRRILVPLDPSPYTEAATNAACFIARAHQSQVGGVAVLDVPGIGSDLAPAVGPFLPGVASEFMARLAHAGDTVKDSLARFSEQCEENHVPHWEIEYEGIPAEKFLASSIFADLVVMGLRTSFHFETRKVDGPRELTSFLDRTVTPVLAVPEKGLDTISKVCLAFDGSIGSACAMQDFVDVAIPFSPAVTILVAGKPQNEADFLLSEAASFLRSHGIEQIETIASSAPVADAVNALDVDLIVAGIHSKKPIKDLFVGSLVKGLIEKGDTALYLSH